MTNIPSPMLDSSSSLGELLDGALDGLRSELICTLQELVRIPSENLPPAGNERTCHLYVADCLRRCGLQPDIYDLADAATLRSHPEYWPGRQYAGRPNVNAVLEGTGWNRSPILSGHIETVPADTPVEWRYPPFGAEVQGDRLFGRGTWEEFGGVNGTLARRIRGYNADAAVLQGEGGILPSERTPAPAVDQLSYVLARLPEFAKRRERRVSIDAYYTNSKEPFAVWVDEHSDGPVGLDTAHHDSGALSRRDLLAIHA